MKMTKDGFCFESLGRIICGLSARYHFTQCPNAAFARHAAEYLNIHCALTLNLDISSNSTSKASQERAKKRSEMEAKRVLYKGSFSLKTSSK